MPVDDSEFERRRCKMTNSSDVTIQAWQGYWCFLRLGRYGGRWTWQTTGIDVWTGTGDSRVES